MTVALVDRWGELSTAADAADTAVDAADAAADAAEQRNEVEGVPGRTGDKTIAVINAEGGKRKRELRRKRGREGGKEEGRGGKQGCIHVVHDRSRMTVCLAYALPVRVELWVCLSSWPRDTAMMLL